MWRMYWTWKEKTNNYLRKLNIAFLKKHWYLDKDISYKRGSIYWSISWQENWNIWIEISKWKEDWFLRVFFTQTDNDTRKKERFDYKINLASTVCNYWGVRWWFLCPISWIRCSILYLQNNWIFGSRKALWLCYEKQNMDKKWRNLAKLFPDEYKAQEIYKTIKYKYRNWKETRKYKRYLKFMKPEISLEDMIKIEESFYKLWIK